MTYLSHRLQYLRCYPDINLYELIYLLCYDLSIVRNLTATKSRKLSLSLHYLGHISEPSFVHGQEMGSRRIWAFLSNTTSTQFPYQLKYQ